MKLLTVVGARPQFIKAAAVSGSIEAHNRGAIGGARIEEVLVHTGQHYDYEMSALLFQELRLRAPAYHLGVGSGTHGVQTGLMMQEIEQVVLQERPDVVLVYGDTNSTLAGALVGEKLRISVAHVEAGLRSGNRQMPEEINRIVTDRVSSFLFCPTETAVANLRREGITAGVMLVGDVMYQLLREHASTAPPARLLTRLGIRPREYALATIHRAENTDTPERLGAILAALSLLSSKLPVVCPLHPRTRVAVQEAAFSLAPGVHVTEPVGYREMVALERGARLVLTDSGGVQKEAYWLGVPCVILRDETEWVETLDSGRNVLASADPERIGLAATELLELGPLDPVTACPADAAASLVRALGHAQRSAGG